MKRATTTFHAAGGLTVVEGSLYDDKDAVVCKHPELFEDAAAAALRMTDQPPVFRARPVEQATAAPGEKRDTRRT